MRIPTGKELAANLERKWTAEVYELLQKKKLTSEELAKLELRRSQVAVIRAKGRAQ